MVKLVKRIDMFAGAFFMFEAVLYIAYFNPLFLLLPWDTLSLWASWLCYVIFFTLGLVFVIRGFLLFFGFEDLGDADYYASILSLLLWIIIALWDLFSSGTSLVLFSAISLFNFLFIIHQTRSRKNRQPFMLWARKSRETRQRAGTG